MGFLDHSTNNIIVDAVLTDHGRKALANNDGSFHIHQFALADDEVDYAIVQHYGRTVGKEKIEKNTPVMEALTTSNLALKYPLISISNEFLTHAPVMTVKNTSTLTFDRKSNTTTGTLDLEVENQTGLGIEPELLDSEFVIEVPHLFLGVTGYTPESVSTDNIATYRVPSSQSSTGSKVKFSVPLQAKSLSTTTFDNHTVSGQDYVSCFVNIRGVNTGQRTTSNILMY